MRARTAIASLVAVFVFSGAAYGSPEVVDSIRAFIRTADAMMAANRMLARSDLGAVPTIAPAPGRVSSRFGMRRHPVWRVNCFHAGLDICNKKGTPVVATGGGVVEFAGRSRRYAGYGNVVVIRHSPRVTTLVGHLDTVLVKAGDDVRRGEVVGLMGRTGTATGCHVHYEVIVEGARVDPEEWIL